MNSFVQNLPLWAVLESKISPPGAYPPKSGKIDSVVNVSQFTANELTRLSELSSTPVVFLPSGLSLATRFHTCHIASKFS